MQTGLIHYGTSTSGSNELQLGSKAHRKPKAPEGRGPSEESRTAPVRTAYSATRSRSLRPPNTKLFCGELIVS